MSSQDQSTISAIEPEKVPNEPFAPVTAAKHHQWSLCWTDLTGSRRNHVVSHQPIKIGNSARCEIRLSDSESKPLHVVINGSDTSVEARSWVEGTLLNGAHFTTSSIREGDILTVGSQDFELHCLEDQEKTVSSKTADTLSTNPTNSISHVLEEELRDRIAFNYQRAKRLIHALRVERSEVLCKSNRIDELEQLKADLSTQLESVNEENASLRSTSFELEQALLEAHEYLSSLREEEVATEEITTNTESVAHDETLEFADEYPDESSEERAPELHHAPAIEQEGEIDTYSIAEESHLSIEQDSEIPEDDYPETVSTDLTEYDRSVEDISDDLDVAADNLLVDELVEQESPIDDVSPTWQVEELIEEEHVSAPSIETDESPLESSQENRIDELFGAHQAEESEESKPFVPTSFIDNYETDEEVQEEFSGTPEIEPYQEPIINSEEVVQEANSTLEQPNNESDDSIDDYLHAMMARIAGGPDAEEVAAAQKDPKQFSEALGSQINTSEIQAEDLPKFQDLSELCKSFAPERGTDMETLRNLANDSARKAIQTAQADQWKSTVARKFGSVGIGLVGSLVGLVTAPSIASTQSILCICLIAAWGYAGLRALISTQADATLEIDLQAHLNRVKEASL